MCDLCHNNIATVHLTEIVEDKVIEVHVCQKCSRVKTKDLKQQLTAPESLTDIMGELDLSREKAVKKCSFCDTTMDNFKKNGRLGCAHCYASFRLQLIPLIKKIQGATHHKGKVPFHVKENLVFNRKIKSMRERLRRAIQLEEYEEAARYYAEPSRISLFHGRKWLGFWDAAFATFWEIDAFRKRVCSKGVPKIFTLNTFTKFHPSGD